LDLYYQYFLDCENISATQAQIGNLIKLISFIFKYLCSIFIKHILTITTGATCLRVIDLLIHGLTEAGAQWMTTDFLCAWWFSLF
jgi:hypothetical protein